MKEFQDSQNRRWEVRLNVAAVKRVRDLAGVDLLTAVDGKLFEELAGDPVKLCDVLFAVVKPQADAAGVTDEQFAEGIAGDAIDAAVTAFLEELCGFFPRPRRDLLTKALAKLKKLERITADAAAAVLDGDTMERVLQEELANADAETELRAALAEARERTAGESSTRPPA